MKTITLQVEEGKVSVLLAFLETLDYVEVAEAPLLSEEGKAFLEERLRLHKSSEQEAQTREDFIEKLKNQYPA